MKANAVLLNPKDNVVTVVRNIKKGEEVSYFNGDTLCKMNAATDIPEWNKMAIVDISNGAEIIKYGELIGIATEAIMAGEYTSHLNIDSLPRDYAAEIK